MKPTPEQIEQLPDLLHCPFCGGPVELEQPAPTWDKIMGRRVGVR